MGAPVPTLSTRGWVTNTQEKIDFLFAHFLEAEVSYNIQNSIVRNGHDIPALILDLQTNLEVYLYKYFQTVQLDIREDPNDDPASSTINLLVNCTVVDNNMQYSVGLVLQSQNSRFKIVANMNNYGAI
jgi:translation initiation factor 2 beta subunit (eIF-2beta)/eIF-5